MSQVFQRLDKVSEKVALDRVRALLKDGKAHAALEMCLELLDASPCFAEAHKLKGQALCKLGDLSQAHEAYKKAIQINPDYVEAYVNLGALTASRQEWSIAEGYFRKAITIDLAFAGAHRNLARVLQQAGREEEAVSAWLQALMLDLEAIPIKVHHWLAQSLIARGEWLSSVSTWQLLARRDRSYRTEAATNIELATQKLKRGQDVLVQPDTLHGWDSRSAARSLGRDTLAAANGRSTLKSGTQSHAANNKMTPLTPKAALGADWEALCLLAQAYCDRRQWAKAARTCQQALQIKRTAPILKLLGNALGSLGQLDQAEAVYREALQLQPRFPAVFANLGSLYAQQQRWDRAIASFRQALRLDPKFAGAYRNFAKVWEKVGDEARAVECWHRALEIEPEWATVGEHVTLGNRWLKLGEVVKAERCYRRAIVSGSSSVEALNNLAVVLSQQGKLESARSVLEAGVKSHGRHLGLLQVLANVLVRLEEWAAAVDCYGVLAEVVPQGFVAQCEFASVLRSQGLTEEAIRVYRRALEFAPDVFELNAGLAEVLVELERWDEACEVYEVLREVRPGEGMMQALFAEALLGADRVELAVEVLERSLAVCDTEAHLHHLWGDVLMRQEKWKKAVKAYKRAIALRPDFSWSHHNLGEALVHRECLKAAVKAYERAVCLNPEFKWSLFNLGQVLLSLGRFEAAVAAFKRVKRLDSETPWLAKHLGDALRGLAMVTVKEAVKWYGRAIEEDPGDLQNYHKALDLQGDDADLYVKLADELARQGKGDGATVFYQMALQLQPDDAGIFRQLEQVSSKKGGQQANFFFEGDFDLTADESQPEDVRLIAFYLPQYHPIPENDEWWGKGFTEWTNVTKAQPLFEGHYQPHLPADLGFYDLRVPEVREQQAELARQYGIYGFCYYYYWFAGKCLLHHPIDEVLRTQKPDFPFCICWANENWTRRWDGYDNEILMAQDCSNDEQNQAFAEHIVPILLDERYIRINGAPLLIIYRADLFPNLLKTAQQWRDIFRKNGVGEVHLCVALTFGFNKHSHEVGFDSAVQFPPNTFSNREILPGELGINDFSGKIFDYKNLAVNSVSQQPQERVFLSVMTSWDNTARRKDTAHIYLNSSPEAYEFWLRGVIEKTKQVHSGDRRLVFINAWNEWAEGAHLEPDIKYGHAYLAATKKALLAQHSWKTAVDVLRYCTPDNSHQLEELIADLCETIANADPDPQAVYEALVKVGLINYLKSYPNLTPKSSKLLQDLEMLINYYSS